ncbi:MAG: histidine--tRNA ligase [Ferruginibacter sp.]|nr:histidine--tRNA ligase [Cytophagales bacterium]
MTKPSVPKGTRDFGPDQMVKRNFIFDTIRRTFQRYGFLPLETPAMENLSVLMGKYGEEGDQLLFKILNSGDFAAELGEPDWREGSKKVTPKIAEKGLRYDLTVPFARYVAMNRHEITFPFRRYQMQPVWRADRPQRGRYREFYQCDADVVGTGSLLCEAEIVGMILEILDGLGIPDFTLKINHRQILAGIAAVIGAEGKEGEMCVAIDKLDKIGRAAVVEELRQRGFSDDAVRKLDPVFELGGSTAERFAQLKALLTSSEAGLRGVDELEQVWQLTRDSGLPDERMLLDVTLARGLSYYTGAIFEVKPNHGSVGSISGGGRYDNLTGAFGLKDVSGVGISFGVDRIYDVMEALNGFPADHYATTQVMFTHFDAEAGRYALPLLRQLRGAGINAELYPEPGKLKKQLDYANQKNVPYVILIGSDEMQTGQLTLKNMQMGTQRKLTMAEVLAVLKPVGSWQ